MHLTFKRVVYSLFNRLKLEVAVDPCEGVWIDHAELLFVSALLNLDFCYGVISFVFEALVGFIHESVIVAIEHWTI